MGTTPTQPRSGRPRKMTERGQQMLRRIMCRNRQLSAESITTDLQTSCVLQISSRTVCRELHGMGFQAEQLHLSHTSPSAMRRMQWCKAHRHWTLEQFGLAAARKMVLVWLHYAKCKVGGGDYSVGLISGAGLGPLLPGKGTLNCSASKRFRTNP